MEFSDEKLAALIEMIRGKGWKITTAESCTGGLIGGRITDLTGVSDTFVGGVISYANEIKERVLGVKGLTLADYGAVSEETASEMVLGVCDFMDAETAVAVTGIAGPGGGSDEKPVGLVYIASCIEGDVIVTKNLFDGNREKIRKMTVTTALNQLYSHLEKKIS